MSKELLINAALAAAWVAIGALADMPWEYAVPLAGIARIIVGVIATKLGKPIPVDQ